jgi:2-oxoglutarate ferredoxin oxidoreductase subunit delta
MPKGRIAIDSEQCKGCALCTTACQPRLIYMDTRYLNGLGYHPARLVDPDGQCTGCGLCAVICPDVCITVYQRRVPRSHPEAAGVLP